MTAAIQIVSAASLRRTALLALAWLCGAVGLVGLFLPLVPGVFMLTVAAWLAAGSSPRLRARIFALPGVGYDVRMFLEQGTVRPHVRRNALIGMALAAPIPVLVLGAATPGTITALAGMALGAAYVATRPVAQPSPGV